MIYVIVFKVVTLRMFTFYYFLLYINDAIAVQEIFCKFIAFGYGFLSNSLLFIQRNVSYANLQTCIEI